MSATLDKIKEELDKIKEEIRTLPPEEQQEVRGLVDSLLSEPASPAEPLDCAPERRWLTEHGGEYAGQVGKVQGKHGCEEVRAHFEAYTLSPINKNVKLKEAFNARKPITQYDPAASGAMDYLRAGFHRGAYATPVLEERQAAGRGGRKEGGRESGDRNEG